MRVPTGRSYWIDRPRSPRRAWPTHCAYCTGIGRSSPRACRTRATESGLASRPRMMRAGSPGSTRTTTKTSNETKKRVTARAPTRRKTYRCNYFCQATSERSRTGAGWSFHSPVTPFLVMTSRGGLVGQHLLHLDVERAPALVVHRDLRVRIELLELGAVPAEVVLGVGEV